MDISCLPNTWLACFTSLLSLGRVGKWDKVSRRAKFFSKKETRNSLVCRRLEMFFNRLQGQRLFEDDFNLGCLVGTGSFGKVYQATRKNAWSGSTTQFAVKIMSLDQERDTLARELHALASLDHPHVLALYSWFETSTQLKIVTELCMGGTLADRPRPYPTQDLVPVFQAIFSALAHCHARGIMHRDIKPANVLFTVDGTAKLGDWGLSTFVGNEIHVRTAGGTIFYVAPEVVTPPFTASFRSDIWSTGVMLYIYLHNYHPFITEEQSLATYRRLLRDGVTMLPTHADLEPRLASLLVGCLQVNAELRPSAAEAWRRCTMLCATVREDRVEHAVSMIRDYCFRGKKPVDIDHVDSSQFHAQTFLALATDDGMIRDGNVTIEYSEFVFAMMDACPDVVSETDETAPGSVSPRKSFSDSMSTA